MYVGHGGRLKVIMIRDAQVNGQ